MSWKGVITNAGITLLSQWAEGGHALNITGATIGSGTCAESAMRGRTALVTSKTSAKIVTKVQISNGVKIRVRMGPSPTAVGAFTGKEIGIWANLDNGADVLLAYHTDSTGVSIPVETASPEFAFDLVCPILMSNDGDFNITIDPSVYASYTTLQEMIEMVVVNFGTVSSMPKTVSDSDITSDMVPVRWEFGTESSLASEPTITITNGQAVLNGTLNSGMSTTAVVYLSHETNAFGLLKGEKGNKGDKGDPGDAYIDDAAGRGDTAKVWSADKTVKEFVKENLLDDSVIGTTESVVYDGHGDIQKVLHKDGNNTTIRTDEFTFSDAYIIEVRTMNTGESLTITTDLATMGTSYTYSAS